MSSLAREVIAKPEVVAILEEWAQIVYGNAMRGTISMESLGISRYDFRNEAIADIVTKIKIYILENWSSISAHMLQKRYSKVEMLFEKHVRQHIFGVSDEETTGSLAQETTATEPAGGIDAVETAAVPEPEETHDPLNQQEQDDYDEDPGGAATGNQQAAPSPSFGGASARGKPVKRYLKKYLVKDLRTVSVETVPWKILNKAVTGALRVEACTNPSLHYLRGYFGYPATTVNLVCVSEAQFASLTRLDLSGWRFHPVSCDEISEAGKSRFTTRKNIAKLAKDFWEDSVGHPAIEAAFPEKNFLLPVSQLVSFILERYPEYGAGLSSFGGLSGVELDYELQVRERLGRRLSFMESVDVEALEHLARESAAALPIPQRVVFGAYYTQAKSFMPPSQDKVTFGDLDRATGRTDSSDLYYEAEERVFKWWRGLWKRFGLVLQGEEDKLDFFRFFVGCVADACLEGSGTVTGPRP